MSGFTDNTSLSRFEWIEDGLLSYADYNWDNGVLVIPHVETDPDLRGKGAAGRLMEAVFSLAKERGWKIRPVCSYAVAWLLKRPDFAAQME